MPGKHDDRPDVRVTELTGRFCAEILEFGYEAFDAFCVDPDTLSRPACEGNWVVASYDMALIRDYLVEGMAAVCPALTEVGRSVAPFDYVEFLDRIGSDNVSARWQKRLLRLYGVYHTWLVPMSSLRYLKGVTVYMRGRGTLAAERFQTTRDEIHVRAVRFFEALEALQPGIPGDMTRGRPHDGPLTEREAECLHWAAEGKTNQQIAVILGVSENTVRFHFKNVLRRLNVSSRTQAVARLRSARSLPRES